jgi:phosphohistidine phosphatase
LKSYSNHKDIQYKAVILFRHGKSDWDAQYDSDHDRPLAKRGIRDAKRMGKFLSKRAEVPELILSSTALRTRETTKLAMEAGNWDVDIELEKKIYEASLEEIINIIKSQDDKYNSICLVGHEPIFSTIITLIDNKKKIKFPTATMARISFSTSDWKRVLLEPDKCKLDWFYKPKSIS